MKRISSILLACLLGALTLVGNLSAQTINAAGTFDWQSPSWGIPNYWPGRNNDGSTAIFGPGVAGAVIMNNAGGVANRVKVLDFSAGVGGTLTLNGTGTLIIGALKLNSPATAVLTIGPGLNVVVDSIIDGASGTQILILAGGQLTLRKGAGAPAVQIVDGGTVLQAGTVAQASANSTLVIENGFNNGVFPTGLGGAFINNYPGEIQVNGNFNVNDTYNRPAVNPAGQNVAPLTLVSGTLTVTPGVTMTLNPVSPNSLQGAGTLQSAVGGIIAVANNFNAGIIPGARFASPFFGQLQFVAGNFIINSSMTLGTPNGTASQQGIMNIVAAASNITVAAGANLTLNGTIANSLQGAGFLTAANGGTITLGPGFNTGTIPARFATIAGNLVTQGPLQWNIAGGVDPFSTTATFTIGGDLSLIGAGRFAFTPTAPNALNATGGARISAQGPNTVFMFNANSNNGVLPGSIFSAPYDGGITVNGPLNLTGTLNMSTVSGPFQFNNHGSVVTIQAGAELYLQRNSAGAVLGQPVNPAGTAGIAYTSYFQGISSASTLRLGQGFNGGAVPTAITGGGTMIPFLPLPGGTTGTVLAFNGRLVLEGSLTFNRDLRIGPSGSIVLGGNLTVAQGRSLELYNSGANTISGTGFLQGVAPTDNWPSPAFAVAASGSIINLGPGFNGAVIPAGRFANPYQGNLCVSTAGNLSIEGNLVLGVPGTRSFLNFNQSYDREIGLSDVMGATVYTRITTTSTSRLLINPNSSLRLNGIATNSIYGAASNTPAVSPVNTIQGTDITSRLIIGTGFGSGGNVYARIGTNATMLASPFNGTLEFDSFAYLSTDATIGVNSQIVLGGTLILTTATVRGNANPGGTGPNPGRINGTTLTLLNQGANTITGLGDMQAGTGNTIVLGANANAGILPGNRFSNPHYGTIATVGAMTLNGFLQMGAQRDGVPNGSNNQHVSSSFLALGGRLTVGAGSVLTVSNATVNPFVVYDPLTFAFGQRLFQISTAGNLDAAVGGEIRLADGFASMDGRSYAAEGGAINGGLSWDVAAGASNLTTPTRSRIRGDNFASPFNGRLSIGFPIGTGAAAPANLSAVGGRSRFGLTTGTLTIGPSGSLNLVSPLYVTAANLPLGNPAFSNGLPVLVLNNTGAGSLLTATTGSFVQSSVGTFHAGPLNNNGAAPATTTYQLFTISAGNETTLTTGGTVVLGPGFNAGVIEGKQFGDQYGFSGRLRLPASGNFGLASNLTMMSPSALGAAIATGAPGVGTLNYGILDLGGSSGTPLVTIADGITLSLGTTATYQFNNTGLALQGTGRIQAASNNATLRFNGTHGAPQPNTAFAAATAPQTVPPRSMTVTAANIASPFNGRLVFNTSGTAMVVGNIVLGAPGSANGILQLNRLDGTAGVTNSPTFIPVGDQSSLTINNTSPVAAVLPGTGIVSATTNFGSIILGPNALANILPAAQLQNPFIGRLIVTTGSAAFTLGADLRLANEPTTPAGRNFPGAANGYLHAFSPININSGITLSVHNTSQEALRGTGPIQGADGNAVVRFLAESHTGTNAIGGNNNVVPGNLFASPYNGRVSLESVAAGPGASTVGYHLYGALTLGAQGTANGFLNVSGATLYLAASTGGTVTGTEATLTINNTLPVEQTLPGGGAIYPKGETGGNANGRNSRWIFGPGSLANILPLHKATTGTVAATGIAATTLPVASHWNTIGIYGTIITPNTSVSVSNANYISFNNGGSLVIGGTGTASTTAEIVLNNAMRVGINSQHANALSGIGVIRATVTNAIVSFGPSDVATFANGGFIPGANFSQNYNGSIQYQSNMTQTGLLRLGDGSGTTGRIIAAAAAGTSLYTVAAGATLDFRTVTNGIGNTSATVATGLLAGVDSTSRVILHPNFATNVGIATPTSALINQNQALFNSPFLGAIITSTGTTTLFGATPVTLTIGGGTAARTTGALEMGGDFVVPVNTTLTMNQVGSNSFRRSNSTALLLANPAGTLSVAGVPAPATVNLGSEFNNSILPVNQIGSATAVPNAFGNATVPTAERNAVLNINGGPFLTLSGASGSATTPANFTINQDLNFTNLGGGIHIPASSTLRVLQGFTAAATAAPVSQGYIQGTTGFGTTQSVLSIGAQTRSVGNSLTTTTPVVGSIRAASTAGVPAFTGVLRFEGNGNITGIAVTLGTTSALDLALTSAGSLLTVNGTSTLNLLNQGANSVILGNAASFIQGTGASAVINLGPNFNAGILPGAAFGPTTTGLQATMNLGGAGSPAAPGSTLTLGSALSIGNNGVFDFTGNNNDLILGANNATMRGLIRNQTLVSTTPTLNAQFFVTNGTGELRIAGVGSSTFHIGPSQSVFTPVTIVNNGTPAIFGARALTPPTQVPALATGSTTHRMPTVNQQWNITQVDNIVAGSAVSIAPSWLASQENAGFNRPVAVTTAYPATPVSSSPAPAISDPAFANYFRSAVTIVQTAGNLLNNTPVLVTSQPRPAIITVTPTAQASGATIRIIGNRFVSGAAVSLGGVNVPAANITLRPGSSLAVADTLVVTVPVNAVSGDVVVTQPGGGASFSSFTMLGAPAQSPTIFRVLPSPIPAGIGDVITTITGVAFGTNTPRVVAVGNGLTATLIPSFNSTTTITVNVPAEIVRNPGTLQLTITSVERLPVSTNVSIIVAPALVLNSLTPSSTTGNLNPFAIEVRGSNFSAQSSFTLGNSRFRVLGITQNSDGTLTASVEAPVGVQTGSFTVTNINGQTASLPFQVNALPRPVITSVNPPLVPPGSPDVVVTVRGRFLIPGAAASFNGTPLPGGILSGDSVFTVTIPAALLANPDLAVLTITNPDGQSIGYRLPITTAAPGSVSLSLTGGLTPSTTTASGSAFTITINGTGFAGTPRVFVGGQTITVASTSDTRLTAIVPAGLNQTGLSPTVYAVQVVNPSGVSSNALMLTINPNSTTPPPAITRVTPTPITTAGGNIIIVGRDFATGARVALGSTQLTIVSASATQIVATVPTGLAVGNYTLSVTNPDGQSASQTYQVVVSVAVEPLAGVRVYPNPVVEQVTVSANVERAAKVVITVTNSLGQRVMVEEHNAAAGFFSRNLNISNLPTGAYMVEITDGTRRSVEKIVKN